MFERRKRKTCAGLESNPRPLAHAPAPDAFAVARGARSTRSHCTFSRSCRHHRLFLLFNISEKSRLFWVEPERQRAREREREEEGFVGAMATEFATTKEACDEAQVPQVWRDACAHLLIPLNACRKKEFYLPWKYVNTNTTLML